MAFTQNRQSAYDMMLATLRDYGLQSLASRLSQLVVDGITDQAQLTLELQDSPEWKKRFAGNEALRQKGLPVLSVAEYLAVERSYAQIMKNYGLPGGFYDDPADFADWIGNSVSPNEVQQRVQTYSDLVKRDDPAVKAQLRSMGFSEGDLLAYTMDPKKAQPLIQQKYQTTLIGAAARRAGVATGNDYAQSLADRGVSEQQAIQGFGMISESLGDMERLGDIYGEDYSQRDFEKEVFEQDGASTKKRKRLASQERAAFSGQSGTGRGSLGQDTAGQY